MIFFNNKPHLIEFAMELASGSQFVVTAASEEDALDLVFGRVFHHQTIPGEYQISQIGGMKVLRLVGPKRFHQAMYKCGIWYPVDYISTE